MSLVDNTYWFDESLRSQQTFKISITCILCQSKELVLNTRYSKISPLKMGLRLDGVGGLIKYNIIKDMSK
jgi:hypothetical protein